MSHRLLAGVPHEPSLFWLSTRWSTPRRMAPARSKGGRGAACAAGAAGAGPAAGATGGAGAGAGGAGAGALSSAAAPPAPRARARTEAASAIGKASSRWTARRLTAARSLRRRRGLEQHALAGLEALEDLHAALAGGAHLHLAGARHAFGAHEHPAHLALLLDRGGGHGQHVAALLGAELQLAGQAREQARIARVEREHDVVLALHARGREHAQR